MMKFYNRFDQDRLHPDLGTRRFPDSEWGHSTAFGKSSEFHEVDSYDYPSAPFRLGRPKNYRGLGPQGYRRSSERIREDACEALLRNPYVDATDIDVNVDEGCLYLRGTVSDRRSKREAEDCVANLPGVEDVQNRLRIKPTSSVTGEGVSGVS